MNNIPNNIYNMLNYIDKGFKLSEKALVDLDNTHSILDIYSSLFELAYDQFELTQKVYIKQKESLHRPIGIIDIAETVRTGDLYKGKYVCTRDEIIDNSEILEVIKLAAVILKDRQQGKASKQLTKILNKLKQVEDITNTEAQHIIKDIYDLSPSEKTIVAISKWVIRSESIVLNSENKADKTYAVNTLGMHRLFEEFIREYLKRKYKKSGSSISGRRYTLGDDGENRISYIETDVTIRWEGRKRASIIEMKYYKDVFEKNGNIRQSHYNQVAEYIAEEKDKTGFKTSGVIIYGQVMDNGLVGEIRELKLKHRRFRMSYAILNLNASFADITKMLDNIYTAEYKKD